ncbi:nuclear transcription factor Y subunit C-3-like isoform X2 [Tasmannia lanceolata]|uniref:nuclear transcription factor Y subunit C-3-like isoform X2 n=1 Tax=Tasmannia lanceolata TaxID=3420 RepID=UPI0040635133
MDPNYALGFSSSSSSFTYMHNFMNVPLPMFPIHSHEFGGRAANCRINMMEFERQYMQMFWQHQMVEVDRISEFRQHQLPLARIKRVMKADEDVKKRRTLQRSDIATTISRAVVLDFLLDVVPMDDEIMNEEELQGNWVGHESLPCNGMHFNVMHPNPFNQTLHEDNVSRQTETSHQFMVQQSFSSSHHSYGTPQ